MKNLEQINDQLEKFWTRGKVAKFIRLFLESNLESRDVDWDNQENWTNKLEKRKLDYLAKIQAILRFEANDFEFLVYEVYFLSSLGSDEDALIKAKQLLKKADQFLEIPNAENSDHRKLIAILWLTVAYSLDLHKFVGGTEGYLAIYTKAFQADPSNVTAATLLADTLTESDEGYPEACLVLDKSIELNTSKRKLVRLYRQAAYLASIFADYDRAVYFYELCENIKKLTSHDIERYLKCLTYVIWVAENSVNDSSKILRWLDIYKVRDNYTPIGYEIYFDKIIKETLAEYLTDRTPHNMAKLAMCFELYPFHGAQNISGVLEKEIDDSFSQDNPNYFNQLCEVVIPEINARLNELAEGKHIFNLKNPFPPVMGKNKLGSWTYPKNQTFGNSGNIEDGFIEI